MTSVIDYDAMGLRKIGEGEYCKVYYLGDGNVLKVPNFRGTVKEQDAILERQKIAAEIVENTNILLKLFPTIIVPTYLGTGGTIIQKYIKGISYSRCSPSMQHEIQKIIDEASELEFPDGFVDTNRGNFKVREKTKEIFWFDPYCPSCY